jgi:hypothetical protein
MTLADGVEPFEYVARHTSNLPEDRESINGRNTPSFPMGMLNFPLLLMMRRKGPSMNALFDPQLSIPNSLG